MLNSVRTTVLGGLFFLLPIAASLLVLEKVVSTAAKMASPLAALLPFSNPVAVLIVYVAAITLLIAISFAAGVLLKKFPYERKIMPYLEDKILRKFPPYVTAKKYTNLIAGIEVNDGMQPALIQVGQAWQLGFIVEKLGNSQLVAFVPSAPDPSSGDIYIVAESQISALNVPNHLVVDCIEKTGRGASRIFTQSHANLH